MSIEQNLFDAFDILIDRKLQLAEFDKTIKAIVVECKDETKGIYKIKYQDSLYEVTADSGVKYVKNAEVYVLVPGGNFSAEKKIIGTVKAMGANYINAIDGDAGYEYIGANIISKQEEIKLFSYKNSSETLYDADREENPLEIDIDAMNEYLKQSTHMIIGAQFKTALEREQQNYGDYGIVVVAEFSDTTKVYALGVDNMIGQPYKLSTYTRQIAEFEINGEEFIRIKQIIAYTKNFPNQSDSKPADIWATNFEINGAKIIDPAALDSYYLTLVTPQGTFFPNDSLKELTLKAEIKIKGCVIDNELHNTKFYWFEENASIDTLDKLYNHHGGQGWKCLNEYRIIDGVTEIDEEGNEIVLQNDRVEWVPSKDSLIISYNDILAKEKRYKCVCVYDDTMDLSKEVIIKNYGAKHDIQLISTHGTEFSYDQGTTTLKCLVDNEENLDYNYVWAKKENASQNYIRMVETQDENTKYNLAKSVKGILEKKFKSEEAFKNQPYISLGVDYTEFEKDFYIGGMTYEAFYNSIVSYLLDKRIERLEKNILHNLSAKSITNFTEYSCSVFNKENNLIGTSSIKIYNRFDTQKTHTLIIHNGTQIFKYNENGVSPTHESNERPQETPTLSFTLFDEQGNLIEEDTIRRKAKVRWLFPAKDTMLEKVLDDYESTEDKYVYSNTLVMDYKLYPSYNFNRNNNNIELEVEYQNKLIKARTDFTIVKEGSNGTNGTDYICKIVPNIADNEIAPLEPTLTFDKVSATVTMNYRIKGDGENNFDAIKYKNWFKVQVWQVGEEILKPIPETDYTVKWSVLANHYKSDTEDPSAFSVTEDGIFTANDYTSGTQDQGDAANIVKAEVTVTEKVNNKEYREIQLFATLPITTVQLLNPNYKVGMKEGTGFNNVVYSSAGDNPKYDQTNPFEVELFYIKDGVELDISTASEQYKPSYNWTVKGNCYKNGWIENTYLTELTAAEDTLASNQKKYKPANNYTGFVVNNAIEVEVKVDSNTIAKIHKPIHFMLNRHGFAHLNDWDGNSVKVSDKGYVLAPQVGAGKKVGDNAFTGILMGEVQEADKPAETGLFGYSAGQRSIFLNAKDGSAKFGLDGSGSIEIIPGEKALIRSGNYGDKENDKVKGMEIDLSTPKISYASNLFNVDEYGNLVAKSGTIGGWKITSSSLENSDGYVGMKADASDNVPTFWAGKDDPITAPFSVSYKGHLKSTSANIGGWNINKDSIFTGDASEDVNHNNVRISSGNFTRKINGADRENLRLALGTKFGVNSNGILYSNSGIFNSASINEATMNNCKITGDLYLGNNNLKLDSTTITYVYGGSFIPERTSNAFWGYSSSPNGYLTDYSIKVGDKTYMFYAFSSRPPAKDIWPLTGGSIKLHTENKTIYYFT